jgi:acetaldehyde dehydrogenase (acetylating)
MSQETDILKQGEDQAMGLLAHFTSFDPVDVYKAVCSIKCAEILTRAFDTPAYPGVVEIVASFIETTMKAVEGNNGSAAQGRAILGLIEFVCPFQTNPGAEAFAVRMHMFDTIILESAKKLNCESAAKEAVDAMQHDIFLFLLKETIAQSNTQQQETN